jgi:hypothetical protein
MNPPPERRIKARANSRLRIRDDGPAQGLAQLAEHGLGRDAELAESAGAFEERLGRLLVEDARVDRAIVDLAERDQGRQRDASILSAERSALQEREDQRRRLVGERLEGLAAEGGDLRALNGADETELRLDDARLRGVPAELRGDGLVQVDQILNGQVARAAAVSR